MKLFRQVPPIKVLFFVIAFFIMISPLYGSEDMGWDEKIWKERYLECIQGDCLNGKGTTIYYSSQKYIGEFQDGKRHGQGTLIYPDGRAYIGEFKEGKRTGHGTMIYPGGSKISGQFLDSMYVGSVQR